MRSDANQQNVRLPKNVAPVTFAHMYGAGDFSVEATNFALVGVFAREQRVNTLVKVMLRALNSMLPGGDAHSAIYPSITMIGGLERLFCYTKVLSTPSFAR